MLERIVKQNSLGCYACMNKLWRTKSNVLFKNALLAFKGEILHLYAGTQTFLKTHCAFQKIEVLSNRVQYKNHEKTEALDSRSDLKCPEALEISNVDKHE